MAGLAVAALARRVALHRSIDVGARLGLPPLPSREVVLHARVADRQSRNAFRTLSAAFKAASM